MRAAHGDRNSCGGSHAAIYADGVKAAVCDRYGPPEVVQIEEVPKPRPKPGEVLIKVHATTVNRTDCGVRSGHPFIARMFYGLTRPRARVLGNEFAGEVEATGDGVTSYQPGDRVFGFNAGFGVDGEFGAHAEYLVTAADGPIATMPDGFSYEEAAPCTEGSSYALGLIGPAQIGTGQDVLVYGATGAIGSSAVQLLNSMSATMTAVCATPHLAWSGIWERIGSSTTPRVTSPGTRSGTTWSSTRSIRPPSGGAGAS